MIEADALFVRYGAFEAVRGVSFRVEPGQVVGLLGPNGAGKTSLLRVLTGYHFPSGGSARVDSHDVAREPQRVRASVGYLPENAPLYPDMKVREYLGFIADARELRGSQRRRRIERAVQTCGLSDVLSREVRRLSKGYRQRVGLAQAVLDDPPVLVLDEPTSGLDPNQILEIRALIRTLGPRKTVLLSTHIMQEAEALCSRVLILSEGRLAAQGTAGEIARGLKQSTLATVSFKGLLDEKAAESLGRLPGVLGVAELRRAGPERTEVDLRVAPDSDPAEAIYDWAAERGLKTLGLQLQKTSLEELFARLTAGSEEPGRGRPGA
jgi:ABC-2 type transport system ATP-binding protein